MNEINEINEKSGLGERPQRPEHWNEIWVTSGPTDKRNASGFYEVRDVVSGSVRYLAGTLGEAQRVVREHGTLRDMWLFLDNREDELARIKQALVECRERSTNAVPRSSPLSEPLPETAQPESGERAGEQYEYRLVEIGPKEPPGALLVLLNDMGKSGWSLVPGAALLNSVNWKYLLFERYVPPPNPRYVD